MRGASLQYSWLTYRRDQLWFPLAFLALVVVVTLILGHPAIRFSLARGYLGFLLPLVGGILAASAILGDPAIELRFATPVRAAETLGNRLGLILLVQAVCALFFQLFLFALRVDLSPLGGGLGVQRIWLLPTLAFMAVGCAGSLAGAENVVGAFLVGTVWLVELMMKGWFLTNAPYAFLFLGGFVPNHPNLALQQTVLFAASLVLFFLSWLLLHRQERFL